MTKIFIFAISIICLYLPKEIVDNKQKTKSVLIDIMFQDGFKNDTLDFKINDVLIVNNILLNSTVAGFTVLGVKIRQCNNGKFKVDFLDKVKYCSYSKKIKLTFKLNGKISSLMIDWHKGKYVGLGKNDDNTLNLIQQKGPFMYE